MPDLFFDSLDAVPEGLREGAKTNDAGKVVIKVVPQSKLDEFRDNNIKVVQERDAIASKYGKAVEIIGGEDFDAFASGLGELRTTAQRVKDGQLVENKGLEEALADRTAKMREEMQAENARLAQEAKLWKDKHGSTDKRLRQTFVDRAMTDVILDEANGVHAKALPDLLQRAYSVFEVSDDGKLTPKRGDAVVYGGDGATPMTPKEWINTLREEAPYFFKGSNGGGANGGEGKTINGMTTADIAKLDPMARLAIANNEYGKR
jgi:hypothetical protein